MAQVVLSLGSNLGERYVFMRKMEHALGAIGTVLKWSPLYESEPVGVGLDHPVYLNRVVLLRCTHTPEELLLTIQEIERSLERTGKGLLQPRTADIDILLFEGEERNTAALTIPHHALCARRFSLVGAQSVVPWWPWKGETIGQIPLADSLLSQGLVVVCDRD